MKRSNRKSLGGGVLQQLRGVLQKVTGASKGQGWPENATDAWWQVAGATVREADAIAAQSCELESILCEAFSSSLARMKDIREWAGGLPHAMTPDQGEAALAELQRMLAPIKAIHEHLEATKGLLRLFDAEASEADGAKSDETVKKPAGPPEGV